MKMRLASNLRKLLQNPATTPAILFLVCLVTYGLYIPWMGFYWDDWPWIWRFHVYGSQAIRDIDVAFRPLAGVVLWIGAQLAGTDATLWQIYNLLIRWLGSVALWWALRQIWPKRHVSLNWIAILFLVYTGFGQQFVSINSSRHLFPLITFFISIGLTAKAFHNVQHFWGLTVMGVTLSLVTMFTTEYYYGLELSRVGILGLLVHRLNGSKRSKTWAILKAWIPYLIPLIVVFAWRFAASQQVNYEVVVTDQLATSPFQTIWSLISTALVDLWEVSCGVWVRLFSWPSPTIFGPRKTGVYWAIVILGTLGTFLYANLPQQEPSERIWNRWVISLGLASILVSGLPFWATNLEVKLTFPNDRLTLPMMLGASMMAVGLTDLIKFKWTKNLVLALIAGFSIGVHFTNAASYQRDWETQAAFFQQLTWRTPGLEPETAILTPELPVLYSTDNSLTAPLNWIYAPEKPAANLSYGLLYIDLRLGTKITALKLGEPITLEYGPVSFHGSTSQAIVVYFDPPACLRVIQLPYDENLPGMPDLLEAAAPLSDPGFIQADASLPAKLPKHIYRNLPPPTQQWCYYFQKADLARQAGNWERVAELGHIAFNLDDSPNRASERVPFIEAYAHTRDWDQAVDLTLEAIEIDKFMRAMLCDTWERILADLPASEERDAGILKVEASLACELQP